MKIHEYQAKGVLKKFGVAVPRGEMAESRDQAEAAARNLFARRRNRRRCRRRRFTPAVAARAVA